LFGFCIIVVKFCEGGANDKRKEEATDEDEER